MLRSTDRGSTASSSQDSSEQLVDDTVHGLLGHVDNGPRARAVWDVRPRLHRGAQQVGGDDVPD